MITVNLTYTEYNVEKCEKHYPTEQLSTEQLPTEQLPTEQFPTDVIQLAGTTILPSHLSAEEIGTIQEFNKEINKLMSMSPSMGNALGELESLGFSIRLAGHGEGSFCSKADRVIEIDAENLKSPAEFLCTLSHEVGHALYDVNIDISSSDTYVRSRLADEGAAVINNIKVNLEILKNGGPDIGIGFPTHELPLCLNIYNDMMGGNISRSLAEEKIGQLMGDNSITSTSGQPYTLYYREQYESNYPLSKQQCIDISGISVRSPHLSKIPPELLVKLNKEINQLIKSDPSIKDGLKAIGEEWKIMLGAANGGSLCDVDHSTIIIDVMLLADLKQFCLTLSHGLDAAKNNKQTDLT